MESSLGAGWEGTADQVIQYLDSTPRDCHSNKMESGTYDWLGYLSDWMERIPPVTLHIYLDWSRPGLVFRECHIGSYRTEIVVTIWHAEMEVGEHYPMLSL